MAKRNREAAGKSARERAKLQKQAEKRAKQARSSEPSSNTDECALMEEFARLSADYDANQMSSADQSGGVSSQRSVSKRIELALGHPCGCST